MIIFHVLLALFNCICFMLLGVHFGFELFTANIQKKLDNVLDVSMPSDGLLRPIVHTEAKILACLTKACYVAWKRMPREPPNFIRMTFESPDPKFGTWYMILHKREDFNPFDLIETQKKRIEELEQESKEWQADFVSVSDQLKVCQRMIDEREKS